MRKQIQRRPPAGDRYRIKNYGKGWRSEDRRSNVNCNEPARRPLVGKQAGATGCDCARTLHKGIQFAFSAASGTRVWSVIQFTSQVWPPSSEKDCSKWGVFVLIFVQSYRTKMVLPWIVSWV